MAQEVAGSADAEQTVDGAHQQLNRLVLESGEVDPQARARLARILLGGVAIFAIAGGIILKIALGTETHPPKSNRTKVPKA